MNDTSLFKNRDVIIRDDSGRLKEDVLRIIEAGIREVIPYQSTKNIIDYRKDYLKIGSMEFRRSDIRHIYVVGVGKGAFPIAQALNEIFGEEIDEGFVIVKEGESRRLSHIEIFESSHPIPDERSIVGGRRLLQILQKAGEGDLVLAAITGGSSALANLPAEGISIKDLQVINNQLLKSGAEIGKMNAVRKHLCLLKGGRVVEYAQPATVLTFTFDTAPPDMPWPDMSLPDPTTFSDAVKVLQTYGIWENAPESVRKRLQWGCEHPEEETVKNMEGMRHAIISVADPGMACQAAARKAKELGYAPHILSTILEGEARDVGIMMAGISDEIIKYGRPFSCPCALISGGETTVTISGSCGKGGPNQETALGYLEKIRAKSGFVFVSVDTDGTDGPCEIAGGIIDANSRKKLKEMEVDLNKELRKHNASSVLQKIDGALITGHTGTNVMNLRVVLLRQDFSSVSIK